MNQKDYLGYLEIVDYESHDDQDTVHHVLAKDQRIREMIESRAIAEACDHLRGRFDLEQIFRLRGAQRDANLVGHLAEIALYHAYVRIDANVAKTNRKPMYDKAIAWLKACRDGKIDPGLPRLLDETAQAPSVGSNTRLGSVIERLNNEH